MIFFAAAQQGDSTTLAHLLNAGQDVDATDSRGVTALIYASREGHLEIVRLLLDSGSAVDGLGIGQELTPLQQAAWNNNLDCVQLLIERGADINADFDKRPGQSGWTPLMYALDEFASPDTVQSLIECGADVNVRH